MWTFLNEKRQDDIDADLRAKIDADANTTVSRLTFAVAITSCIALFADELTNQYDTNWITHVLLNCIAVIIASCVPLILKKLKVREVVITHAIAILYVSAISIILLSFDSVAGLTVWAVILILVFVSMCYYSNSVVLLYSFISGSVWIVILAIRHPSMWVFIDSTDHVGRFGIFVIMSGIALWVNRMIKRNVLDNHKQIMLIQEYSKELERKNIELQKLDKMKNEFLANTTHELKTPLHGIIGLLEPLLDSGSGAFSDTQLYDISLAVSSAKRLSGLVGDILDFSRLRNQDIILQKQDIDIYILTDMVCKSFAHQAGKKSVRIVNAVAPDNSLVYADENRFLQIMFNLIGNAVKFTESGEIRISAVRTADQIQITVSDTGIGISHERQQLIFKVFEQADSSIAREYGGTGLGLAITKSLVELHAGKLWVESTPGTGSRFTFSIPLIAGSCDKTSTSTTLLQKRWENDPDPDYDIQTVKDQKPVCDEAPRILVVDDEPVNVHIIRNILSREGYSLTTVYSGREALDLLQNGHKFDLVLLDVMMPQLSGLDVCSKIRQIYTLTQLPILLLTAKDMTEDLVDGFNVGANDYLPKPFNIKELTARVKTLLDLKRTSELALSAELYFLQSQIKPHFLHNTLNTIKSFIRTSPELAREMIVELSVYLQESFNFNSMEKTMPISKEISIIKSYIFIEMARFTDRIMVEYDIDESIRCSVPHLILQPIVENAVRHGILEKQSGGTIRITVKCDGHEVLLTVDDDGVGLDPELIPRLLRNEVDGVGIGLYNVHKRMMAIYGHGLEIESQQGYGTKVKLKIPYEEHSGL